MAELEQFLILAKRQKGRACEALIEQVLNNRKIFVFGELLSVPSVAALRDTEYSKSFMTLELFAYGTYKQYVASPETYIELSEAMRTKLRQLSIVSLAEHNKIIPYELLQRELEIDNVRILEDLIIETIYAGIVRGKLDQQKGIFRIKGTGCTHIHTHTHTHSKQHVSPHPHIQTHTHTQGTMGRDVRPEQLQSIIDKLDAWRNMCFTLIKEAEESSKIVRDERNSGEW